MLNLGILTTVELNTILRGTVTCCYYRPMYNMNYKTWGSQGDKHQVYGLLGYDAVAFRNNLSV